MTNNIILENEIQANKFVTRIMRITIIFILGVYMLNRVGIFEIESKTMLMAVIFSSTALIIPTLIVDVMKVNSNWVKYLSITLAILMVGIISICLSYHVVIIYTYGIILTAGFFSKRLNFYALIMSLIILTVSQFLSFKFGFVPDNNAYSMKTLVLFNIIPRQLQLALLSIVFMSFNNRTKELLNMCVGAEQQKEMMDQLVEVSDKSYNISSNLVESVEGLRKTASNSSEASKRITDKTEKVTAGVQNTVNYLEDATDTVNSITGNLDKIAHEGKQVSGLSMKVSEMSKKNGEVMEYATKEMHEINRQTEENKLIISLLGAKSKEIKNITDVISNIADQTNLLALNAAIESARAGEQGKGFAVVAEEIRKLAEQSQKSAAHISQIIKEVDDSTQQAVSAMDESVVVVGKGLSIIEEAKDSSNEMEKVSSEMNETMQELTAIIDQVADGGSQIEEIVSEVKNINSNSKNELEMIVEETKVQLAAAHQVVNAVEEIERNAEELLAISRQENELI